MSQARESLGPLSNSSSSVAQQQQPASKSYGSSFCDGGSAFTSVFGPVTPASTANGQQQMGYGMSVSADSDGSNSQLLRATLLMPPAQLRPYTSRAENAQQHLPPQINQYHHHYATPFGQTINYAARQTSQLPLLHDYGSSYQQQHPISPANTASHSDYSSHFSVNASSPTAAAAGGGGVSGRAAAVSRLTGLIASGPQNSSGIIPSTSRPASRLSGAPVGSPAGAHVVSSEALAAPEVRNKTSATPEAHPILAELLTAPQHQSHSSTSPSVRYSRPPSSMPPVDTPPNNNNAGTIRSAPSQSPSSAFGAPQQHQSSNSAHVSGYTTPAAVTSMSLPTFGDGLSMDLQLDQPYAASNYYNQNGRNFYQHLPDQNQQLQYPRAAALSPMHENSPHLPRMPSSAQSPLPQPPAGSNYGMASSQFPPGMPPPQLPAQQILIARMPLDALRSHQGNTRVMLLPSSMFLSGQFPPNTLLQMPRGELIQLIAAPNMRPGPVQQFFRVLHVGPPVVGPTAMSMPSAPHTVPFNAASAPQLPPGGYRPFPLPQMMPRPPSDVGTTANDVTMASVEAAAALYQQSMGGFQSTGMAFLPPGMFPPSAQQRGLPPVSNLFQPGINSNDMIRAGTVALELNGAHPPGSVLMMPVRLPNGDIVMMPPPSLAAAGGFGQPVMMAATAMPPNHHQTMPSSSSFVIQPTLNSSAAPLEDEKSNFAAAKRRLSSPVATPPPLVSPSHPAPSTPAAPSERTVNNSLPKKRKSAKQRKEEQALLAGLRPGQQPAPLAVGEQQKRKQYPRKPRVQKADPSDASFSSLSTTGDNNLTVSSSSANTTMPVIAVPNEIVEKPAAVGFSPTNSMLSMFRPRRPIGVGAMPAAAVASYINRNKMASAVDRKLSRLQHSRSRSGSRRNSLQSSALLLPSGAIVAKPRSRKHSRHRLSADDATTTDESSQSQSSSANTTLDTTYEDDELLAMYEDDDLYDEDGDEFESDGEDGDTNDDEEGGSKRRSRGGKSGSRGSSRRNSRSTSRRRRGRQFDDDNNLLGSPFKKPHSPPLGSDSDLAALILNRHLHGPRYSLASCDEQQAREIRRRLERKRREHIKGGYDRLKAAVPALFEEVRAPPQRILEATLSYVMKLKQQERKLIVKKIELLQRKKDVEVKFRQALRAHFKQRKSDQPLSSATNQSIMNFLPNSFIAGKNSVDVPNDDIFDMLVSNIYDAVRADAATASQQRRDMTLSSSSSTASLYVVEGAAAEFFAAVPENKTGDDDTLNDEAATKHDDSQLGIVAEIPVDGELPTYTVAKSAGEAHAVAPRIDDLTPAAAAGSGNSNSLPLCSVKNLVLLPRIEPYLPVIDVKTTGSSRSKPFRRFSTWKHVSENAVPQLLSAGAATSSPAHIIQQTLSSNRTREDADRTINNGYADNVENDESFVGAKCEHLPATTGFDRLSKNASSSSWLSAIWPVGMASQLEYDFAAESRRVISASDSGADPVAAAKSVRNFDDAETIFGAGAFSSALRYKHKTSFTASCTSMNSIARFLKKVALVEALVEANDVDGVCAGRDEADRDDGNVGSVITRATNSNFKIFAGAATGRTAKERPPQRILRRRSLSGGAA